jgi:acyl carrier protein
MERVQKLKEINEIFKDVLENNALEISEATRAADVDEWDSLMHIQLIVAIEKHFKIKFTSVEIRTWQNVGEMISCILSKKTS